MRNLLQVWSFVLLANSLHAQSFITADAEYGPGPEPNTYSLKVYIKRISTQNEEESAEVIAAPGLTARIGEEAKVELLGGKNGKDILISSFYPTEKQNSPILCSVEVKENGTSLFRTKLQLRINELTSEKQTSKRLVDFARACMDAGDLERAQRILQAILVVEPTNRAAKYYLENCERTIVKRSKPDPQPRVVFP